MKPSLFREFVATVLGFIAVLFGAWVVYTILTGASHLNDLLLFGRLVATGAPAARVNGVLLVLSEVGALLFLSLAFVFLHRSVRVLCIGIFFLFLLIRHCLISPPDVFRDASALGIFRWFGWLESVFLLAPYVYLSLIAFTAMMGFVPRRLLSRIPRKGQRKVSGVSAAVDHDSGTVFARFLSVTVASVMIFQFAQSEIFRAIKSVENPIAGSPSGDGASGKVLSVYFVVQNLTLNALRNASVNFSTDLNSRMASASQIYAHLPDVLLSRPMRSELMGTSSARHIGVRSNWDIQFVDRLQRDVNVISYRDEYAMHWIWLGEMLFSAVDRIFKDMSRSGINPFFAQMRLDRGFDDVHSFEYSEIEAFRNVRTKLKNMKSTLHPADGRVFVELPPFPSAGSIATQQLFFARAQEIFDLVLDQAGGIGLEQLLLVGLPPEELGRFEFGDKEQATYLITRAAGIALNWVVGETQERRGAGQLDDIQSFNFEERLRQVEDESAVVPTDCIRLLGIFTGGAAAKIPDTCMLKTTMADASEGALLHTEWTTDPRELFSRSELGNFVRLTAPPVYEMERTRVHVVFSRWPRIYWNFQVGDEVLPNDRGVDVRRLRALGFYVHSLAGRWVVLGRD